MTTTNDSKAQGPNDVWAAAFEGRWRRAQYGKPREPLGIRDLHSRYILCLRPVASHQTEDVKAVFAEVFERYSLPDVIRCDNRAPFTSLVGPHGLTRLSAWWRTLGIKLERTEPGHPGQNGGHERMHQDLAREIEGRPSATLAEEARRLERLRVEYNRRPHEALGLKTPDEVYRLSSRRLKDVEPYAYPSGFVRRRVLGDGCIQFGGKYLYLSESLRKLEVGLERLDGTGWRIWFCDLVMRKIRKTERPVRPSIALHRWTRGLEPRGDSNLRRSPFVVRPSRSVVRPAHDVSRKLRHYPNTMLILKLLIDRNWTVADLARKTGYARQYVSETIRGRMLWRGAQGRIAEALGVPIGEVFPRGNGVKGC